MFLVYILYSKSLHRYYIGYTGDRMEIRLQKHLSNHRGFTRSGADWAVMYLENYPNKKDAMRHEKQIKS